MEPHGAYGTYQSDGQQTESVVLLNKHSSPYSNSFLLLRSKRRILISLACLVGLVTLSVCAFAWFPRPSSSLPVTQTKSINAVAKRYPEENECMGPYPGYPRCADKIQTMLKQWNAASDSDKDTLRAKGVDGSYCKMLDYLNSNGFFCPEAVDLVSVKIHGVNLGGWLVLEPWITPSLFEQFNPADKVEDQWSYCAKLGATEAKRQLEKHWDSWLTEQDLITLANAGIDHVRIPVGYWIMGDVQKDEPWVTGDLKYLLRALGWCKAHGISAIIDLHCGPGSQNGFDNSGRKGAIRWPESKLASDGARTYPNIDRTLSVLRHLTAELTNTQHQLDGVVVGVELINEAFISIPIDVVKRFYILGYETVKSFNNDFSVIIGDSFRFDDWSDFMYPPHFRHVWIDTHIYQVFDMYRLRMSWQEHIEQTCKYNKPEVAVAPLSTMVGEWGLATTDCAKWLNGYNTGSRYDGTFPGGSFIDTCEGQNNASTFTPEYRAFLKEWAEKQMDAYETGSSSGWFFWNFKTESAPQWDYLLGIKEGWMPAHASKRTYTCDN